MSSRSRPIRFAALLAAALALLPGRPVLAQTDDTARRLTLVAEGTVIAEPDMATVNLGVVSEARTAAAALEANTASMSGIVAQLKAAGIAERDLQTSGFHVSPVYTRPARRADGQQAAPQIAGYRVHNTLTVRIRDLARTGAILDVVVTLGANSVDGPQFSVAEPEPLRDEARQKAVAAARARAALYAQAAGVTLGAIMSIEEAGGGDPRPVPMARMEAAVADAAVPIEAGELTFREQVRIVWEIE